MRTEARQLIGSATCCHLDETNMDIIKVHREWGEQDVGLSQISDVTGSAGSKMLVKAKYLMKRGVRGARCWSKSNIWCNCEWGEQDIGPNQISDVTGSEMSPTVYIVVRTWICCNWKLDIILNLNLQEHISQILHIPNLNMQERLSQMLHSPNLNLQDHVSQMLHCPNLYLQEHVSQMLHSPKLNLQEHVSQMLLSLNLNLQKQMSQMLLSPNLNLQEHVSQTLHSPNLNLLKHMSQMLHSPNLNLLGRKWRGTAAVPAALLSLELFPSSVHWIKRKS